MPASAAAPTGGAIRLARAAPTAPPTTPPTAAPMPGCSASSVGNVSISPPEALGDTRRRRAAGEARKTSRAPFRALWMDSKMPTTACMDRATSENRAVSTWRYPVPGALAGSGWTGYNSTTGRGRFSNCTSRDEKPVRKPLGNHVAGLAHGLLPSPAGRIRPMLSWAVTFFVIAIIAAVLGLSGVAGMSANIGWLLAVLGVVVLAIGLLARAMGGGRSALP